MAYTYGTITYAKDINGNVVGNNVYQVRLGYQLNSQNTATNKSNISLQLEVRSTSSSYYTYGYNQTTTIDGTTLNAKEFDFRSTNTWQVFGTRTFDVSHNTDGTYSVSKNGSFTTTVTGTGRPKSGSASVTVALPTIPRYTSINTFTVAKRNETSLTFNWATADIIDYVWYSTDDGNNWKGVNVTDGKSGSFIVTQLSANTNSLSPNTTYKCKLRVRRKDSQLTTDTTTAVSQTTYAIPTIGLKSKTETSITMSWSCDSTVDYIQYSTDNGTTWSNSISVNATSSSYQITGLAAYTSYDIKFNIRRKTVETWYATAKSTQSTYQYPYVSAVNSTNLTIGNSQTLTLYNPLGRSVTVYMKKTNTSGTTLYSGTTNTTTTTTFTPTASTLYSSIPSNSSATCVYYCTYSSQTVSTKSGTYVVSSSTNKPTLSSSTFTDTNSTTIGLTGSSSKIVLNASTLQISVVAAGKNYASISTIKIEGSSRTVTAGGSGANLTGSATYSITKPTKSSFTIEITDSRGLVYSGTISIASGNVINYIPLTMVGVGKRNQPTDGKVKISSSGKYFNGSIGNTANTLNTYYRYKEIGGSYSGWQSTTPVLGTGTHSEAQQTLSGFDYTKSFQFQFRAIDKLNTVDSYVTITKGQPIFNWDNDEFNINGALTLYGVPIIENGNNANGYYIKYANGIMVQYNSQTVTDQSISNAYGSFGLYYNTRYVTFPVEFTANPIYVSCGRFKWGTGASWGSVSSYSKTQALLMIFDVRERATGTNCYINWLAVGRWK